MVNDNQINSLVDTGSYTNVIDECTYKLMKYQPNLSKSDIKVYTYEANEKVSLLGKFQATVEAESKLTKGAFLQCILRRAIVDICFHIRQ